jgi:hypothetical protein
VGRYNGKVNYGDRMEEMIDTEDGLKKVCAW